MGGFFMGTELNQALVQQALSFAPEITEERQAVKVWEDGTVEFYLYAPTAETVEVAGVGGYFDAAPLALLPDGNGGFYRKIENARNALLSLVCGRSETVSSESRFFLWLL